MSTTTTTTTKEITMKKSQTRSRGSISLFFKWLAIFHAVTKQTDGRDKVLKIIQYSGKVFLLAAPSFLKEITISTTRIGKSKVQPREWTIRAARLISAFSTARKVIRLGQWVDPVIEFQPFVNKLIVLYLFTSDNGVSRRSSKEFSSNEEISEYSDVETMSSSQLLHSRQKLLSINNILAQSNSFLSILNSVSDDVVCLSKIGVLGPNIGKKYDIYSNWLWLSCIGLDLYEFDDIYKKSCKNIYNLEKQMLIAVDSSKNTDIDGVKTDLNQALKKHKLIKLSIFKALADLGFCAYDVLELKSSPLFQAACGMTSAYLGFYKLWIKSAK